MPLKFDAHIIGVNNRNLKTFQVDIETTGRLRAPSPRASYWRGESGIRDTADVQRMVAEPWAAMPFWWARPSANCRNHSAPKPRRICASRTQLGDSHHAGQGQNLRIDQPRGCPVAVDAADLLGFIFHPKSPRFVEPSHVGEILTALTLPPHVQTVGVFVNRPVAEVSAILAATGLTLAQLHGDEAVDDQPLGGRGYKAVRPTDAAHSPSGPRFHHLSRRPCPPIASRRLSPLRLWRYRAWCTLANGGNHRQCRSPLTLGRWPHRR